MPDDLHVTAGSTTYRKRAAKHTSAEIAQVVTGSSPGRDLRSGDALDTKAKETVQVEQLKEAQLKVAAHLVLA